MTGGCAAADALFYIARSRQELTVRSVPRSELEGTPYARELFPVVLYLKNGNDEEYRLGLQQSA
jgi:hypothetical protein